MSKVAIAYVGPKEFKRDTVTGSRQVFPRHTPIEVSEEVAAVLLRFDKVFVDADQVEAVIEAQKAKEKADKQAALDAAKAQAKHEAETSLVVVLDGKELDLNKLTVPKLATLIEAHDLGVRQEPQEKVADFKLRVRDAIRQKQTD